LNKKEVSVLILGGSGYLGRSVFELLKSTDGISVSGTYYENKPKWVEDNFFSYFNASAVDMDIDMASKIKEADFVLDLMHTNRKDYFDNVFFNTPLNIADMVKSSGGVYVQFSNLANTRNTDAKNDMTSQRLSNVILEKKLGIVLHLAPILSSEANVMKVIKALSKYKLTPILGDGSNKIDAIHKTDFSLVIRRLVMSRIRDGEFYLVGSNVMTIRHLFNIAALQNKQSKPIFLSISDKLFVNYKGVIESLLDTVITTSDLNILMYKEQAVGVSLTQELKVKPLSFDARIKREGT
jgi:nucleoside-diphosphate-sugar epimerase